jgi:hypothetical protein
MAAWSMEWNNLTNEERRQIVTVAEYSACPCCDDAGQTALDVFNAVILVIQERDKKEINATLMA